MFDSIKNYIKTVDLIPVLLFALATVLWRTALAQYSLYLVIPSVIVISFFKYYRHIAHSRYFWPYLLLVGWMFLSSYMTPQTGKALNYMISVVATILLSFSFIALSQKHNNIKVLYLGFVLLFATLMYQVIVSNGQVLVDFDYANERERESVTILDANQYAYFSLFALMSIRLFLGDLYIKRPLLRICLYVVMLVISIYVALITASRQVLLLQIPMISYFVYFDFFKNRKRGRHSNRLFPIIIFVAVIILALPSVLELYGNSYLAVRSESDLGEDTRWELLKIGMRTGFENPIVGIGLGVKSRFTHCTYTHLFSKCGLIPLILFLIIILRSIKEQRERYKSTHDDMFKLYLLCALIFAIANFLYSYINQPFMMTFLFLIIGDSNNRYYGA